MRSVYMQIHYMVKSMCTPDHSDTMGKGYTIHYIV